MKIPGAAVVLIGTLMFANANPVFGADTVPTRAESVAVLHATFDPMFATQNLRFVAIKSKIANNASMLPSFKKVFADFTTVRAFINTNLADEKSDLETVKSYAEEELGEFDVILNLLEVQVAKSKTITCVKGKTVKQIMALKPVCPKGYVKK